MVIETILKWAIPFICGSVVSGSIAYISAMKKRNHALEDGVQCLLRADIIHLHDKYMALGYCPIYVKEALKREYTAYHNLHGNDVATKLYHDVMSLPEEPTEKR